MLSTESIPPVYLAEQIIDCIEDGVLTVDHRWNITSITPLCLKMICSGENWIGKSLWDFLPTNCLYSPHTSQCLSEAIENTTDFTFDSFYTTGAARWFRFSLRPAPIGAIIFLRDLTDQHVIAANHLKDKQLAINALVSTLAHEINNPLQALTNILQLVQQECRELCIQELLGLAESQLCRVSRAANDVFQQHK